MVVSILLCLFIGKWIDGKFGTEPIFIIIFTILGILAGFRNLYILVAKGNKPESPEKILENIVEKEQKDDKNI